LFCNFVQRWFASSRSAPSHMLVACVVNTPPKIFVIEVSIDYGVASESGKARERNVDVAVASRRN
jgi:hypothetical protein